MKHKKTPMYYNSSRGNMNVLTTEQKVSDSPKSLGHILWKTATSVQDIMAIDPKDVRLHHSGGSRVHRQ